jgi:excisionase family DNA binding protein
MVRLEFGSHPLFGYSELAARVSRLEQMILGDDSAGEVSPPPVGPKINLRGHEVGIVIQAPTDDADLLITAETVGQMLKMHRHTVLDHVHAGNLPVAEHRGRRYRIAMSAVHEFDELRKKNPGRMFRLG